MIKQINTNQEFEEILKLSETESKNIYFYADWCKYCNIFSETLTEILKEKDLEVYKINVDNFQNLAIQYNIEYIPTLLKFKNGVPVKKGDHTLSKEELINFLQQK